MELRNFLLKVPPCAIFLISLGLSSQIDSNSTNRIEHNYNMGLDLMYAKKDSALKLFDEAFELAKKQNQKEYVLDIINAKMRTAEYHFDLVKLKQEVNAFDSLINSPQYLNSTLDVNHYKNKLLIDKGAYSYLTCSYAQSRSYFEKLLEALKGFDLNKYDSYQINHKITAQGYLGAIHKRHGKIRLAQDHYKNILNILAKKKDCVQYWESYLYNTKTLIADTYQIEGKHEKSRMLLQEVIAFYESSDWDYYKNSTIECYFLLTKQFLQRGNLIAAQEILKKCQLKIEENTQYRNDFLTLQGDLNLKKENFHFAKNIYDSVLKINIKYYTRVRHLEVSKSYMRLANLERSKKQFPKSLGYYQKSLISACRNFEDKNITGNPSPEDTFSKTQLLTILKNKLEVLNSESLHNPSKKIQSAIKNTSKSIIETLDNLKPEFESKLDKQFLIEQTYPAFHEMLKSAHSDYDKTKNQDLLDDAFLFMEKSKSILLLEAVRNSEAIAFGEVPDSVLEKESQFRAYITHLDKKMVDVGAENLDNLKDSLFNLKNTYYDYIKTIEKKFPDYYKLKYDTKTVSVKEIQDFIDIDETLLQFHQAERELYVITINKLEIDFIKIPLSEEDKNKIKTFYQLLTKPTSKSLKKVESLSQELHQLLIASLDINPNNKKLTIIADGILHYMPFGVLKEGRDYLIRRQSIRYANSATILTRNSELNFPKKIKLLAISPYFDSDSGLRQLPFSKEETNLITNYFEGEILFGKEASMKNFFKVEKNFSLFHFATHASTDDENPDFSHLYFSVDGKDENKLYTKDLYNQNFNVEMVTLSACETGIGKMQNGEGMLSLARGFQFAGVKSLTTTLWKNDDQSTSELMGYYYKHLSEGFNKAEAMQQAKLEYLSNIEEEELKHPYYWAGFVVLGDDSPIADRPISNWVWAGLGLTGIGLLFFGYRKIKGHQVAA